MPTGTLGPEPLTCLNEHRIAALDALERATGLSAVLLDAPEGGPASAGGLTPLVFSFDGVRTQLWDRLFFEAIRVIPREKDVGSVLSTTSFEVEVWCANYHPHLCEGVTIEGPAGVALGGGIALPGWWAPFASVFFTVTVEGLGDPTVDNLLTWDFPGFSGTDCHVTGLRVILFTAAPNDEFEEAYGYLTDVLTAWDGSEQRIGLRSRPSRQFRFRATLGDAAEAAELMARLFATGKFSFSVPVWPDAVEPSAPVAIGAGEIAVETAGCGFEAGGSCILWRDQWTWEAFVIESVEASRLVLRSLATQDWPVAGTLLIPLRPARLLQDTALRRLSPQVAEIDAVFSVEAV
jgi:hypothetical protein